MPHVLVSQIHKDKFQINQTGLDIFHYCHRLGHEDYLFHQDKDSTFLSTIKGSTYNVSCPGHFPSDPHCLINLPSFVNFFILA